MALAEFEEKWAAATESTSPDGATATVLALISGVAKQVKPNNLSVGKIRFGTVTNASDTGVQGEVRFNATHVFFCVATDTWKRVAIATW